MISRVMSQDNDALFAFAVLSRKEVTNQKYASFRALKWHGATGEGRM